MIFVKKYKNACEVGNDLYINLTHVCWFGHPYVRKTETVNYSIDKTRINVSVTKNEFFVIKDISMEDFARDVENAMRALSGKQPSEPECSNASFVKNIDLEN